MPDLTLSSLRAFTGSTEFFRHSLNLSIIYTEGIQHLAEAGGAYWLIDEIALANRFTHPVIVESFQVWDLTRDAIGDSAWLTCEDGNDNAVFSKRIEFTDFPLPTVRLYCEDGGDTRTIMLPSER